MISVEDLKKYPKMTRWFDPRLLSKLLGQVIVGGMFGQYADRRLMMAALDTVSDQELQSRADVTADLGADPDGAIWFDYVSDLGDGFDCTYAVAYQLAQDTLTVDGETLPRGSLLIMGGDEVYPTSSREDYNARLREPYRLAFPNRPGSQHPPVFMVPGNHDWYDGLTSFFAMFCRKKATSLGNWRTRQRRSYFALQLKPDWWVWAIDIALTEDMDQPQADYFVAISNAMPEGAKIILCTAEPGWYGAETKAASFRSLDYAAQLANNAKLPDGKTSKGFKIVVALSGDTHHYARYESGFGTQFVTSGGGGAFLHGTHSLRSAITLDWLKRPSQTLALRACYPSKKESLKLLSGNFRFPLLNWDFGLLLGVIYWPLVFWMAMRPQADTVTMIAILLAAGFGLYGSHQEKGRPGKALGLALLQALAHLLAIWLLSRLFTHHASTWPWFFWVGLWTVPVGGAIAAFIFGVNLWLTSRFANLNHNDAFSSMRLDHHRHFLRLRIKEDALTIYPVGLDRVPKRHQWQANSGPPPGPGVAGSRFVPPTGFGPHLIEPAFTIHAADVMPVAAAVKTPAEQAKGPGGPEVTAGAPPP
jgi:calcineurin-like phosphoesterase family protein